MREQLGTITCTLGNREQGTRKNTAPLPWDCVGARRRLWYPTEDRQPNCNLCQRVAQVCWCRVGRIQFQHICHHWRPQGQRRMQMQGRKAQREMVRCQSSAPCASDSDALPVHLLATIAPEEPRRRMQPRARLSLSLSLLRRWRSKRG